MTATSLPNFENPPVVEVVFGIQFNPLKKFTSPHIGLLWQRYKEKYPNFEEKAPLAPAVESFGDSPSLKLELSGLPPLPRVWFVHEKKNGIIQIQKDRFIYNWRKDLPGDEYPRYPEVKNVFQNHLTTFDSFLQENEIGRIIPNQYELTYVNHIYQGEGWTDLNDIGNVFEDFSWNSAEKNFLPQISNINFRVSFDLPNCEGRLHIKAVKGHIPDENKSLLRLDLSVMGMSPDKTDNGMWNWFDTAREWIVRGFADFTNKSIQKDIWRRK